MGEIARLERVGGHVVIDFVNTLGGLAEAPDDEYLFDYADLVTFAEGGRLIEATAAEQLREAAVREPGLAGAVLERALRLRGSLDRILRSRLGAHPSSGEDLDAVRQAYVTALMRANLRPSDAHCDWAWEPDGDVLDQPLWPLAAYAADLLRSGPLQQLSRCGHCRWLFLDTSKNHSRRWCSMNSCGSVVKMRRYRAARRSCADRPPRRPARAGG